MIKKIVSVMLFMGTTLFFISCGTLFTSSSQEITFTGDSGIGIYDKGQKLVVINDEGIGVAKIRKRLSSKTLTAKKDGYKSKPINLEATLNPIAILNLLDIIGWAVDLGTGKCCKWADEIIEVELEKADNK